MFLQYSLYAHCIRASQSELLAKEFQRTNNLIQYSLLYSLNLVDHRKKISVVAEILAHNKANCIHHRRLPQQNCFVQFPLNVCTDLPRNKTTLRKIIYVVNALKTIDFYIFYIYQFLFFKRTKFHLLIKKKYNGITIFKLPGNNVIPVGL